jgi:hypothetical protein
MRVLITVFSILVWQACYAQQVVDVSKQDVQVGANMFYSVGGEPFVNVKFVNLVEGSPYFKDEWLKGIVVDKTNHEYKGISIKIDLLDNYVHYLDEKEKELLVTTPIKEIVLTDASGNNYRFIHSSSFENCTNATKNSWYLWLSTGTVSLYKSFKKALSEMRPYGSATTEQRIKTTEKYVVLYNNAFLEVKKIKDVPSILTNKKAELEAFLNTKDDQKASMDDRFVKLIEYYNTLTKEQK